LLFTANGSPYINAVVYETFSSPSAHLSYITVKGGGRTQVQSQGIITNIPFPTGSNVSPDDAASIISQTEAYAARYPQYAQLLNGVGELWKRKLDASKAEAAKLEQSRAAAVPTAATASQPGQSFVATGLETVIPLIRTKTGQQFKNARITRFENDQASVSHADGVTKVSLADISNLPDFPPDVRGAVEKVQTDYQTYKKAEEERIAESKKEQERLARVEQERLLKEAQETKLVNEKREKERLERNDLINKSDKVLVQLSVLEQDNNTKNHQQIESARNALKAGDIATAILKYKNAGMDLVADYYSELIRLRENRCQKLLKDAKNKEAENNFNEAIIDYQIVDAVRGGEQPDIKLAIKQLTIRQLNDLIKHKFFIPAQTFVEENSHILDKANLSEDENAQVTSIKSFIKQNIAADEATLSDLKKQISTITTPKRFAANQLQNAVTVAQNLGLTELANQWTLLLKMKPYSPRYRNRSDVSDELKKALFPFNSLPSVSFLTNGNRDMSEKQFSFLQRIDDIGELLNIDPEEMVNQLRDKISRNKKLSCSLVYPQMLDELKQSFEEPVGRLSLAFKDGSTSRRDYGGFTRLLLWDFNIPYRFLLASEFTYIHLKNDKTLDPQIARNYFEIAKDICESNSASHDQITSMAGLLSLPPGVLIKSYAEILPGISFIDDRHLLKATEAESSKYSAIMPQIFEILFPQSASSTDVKQMNGILICHAANVRALTGFTFSQVLNGVLADRLGAASCDSSVFGEQQYPESPGDAASFYFGDWFYAPFNDMLDYAGQSSSTSISMSEIKGLFVKSKYNRIVN